MGWLLQLLQLCRSLHEEWLDLLASQLDWQHLRHLGQHGLRCLSTLVVPLDLLSRGEINNRRKIQQWILTRASFRNLRGPIPSKTPAATVMKHKLQHSFLLMGLMAIPLIAQEHQSSPIAPNPPDKEKVSYALGMNLAMQRKRTDAEIGR